MNEDEREQAMESYLLKSQIWWDSLNDEEKIQIYVDYKYKFAQAVNSELEDKE